MLQQLTLASCPTLADSFACIFEKSDILCGTPTPASVCSVVPETGVGSARRSASEKGHTLCVAAMPVAAVTPTLEPNSGPYRCRRAETMCAKSQDWCVSEPGLRIPDIAASSRLAQRPAVSLSHLAHAGGPGEKSVCGRVSTRKNWFRTVEHVLLPDRTSSATRRCSSESWGEDVGASSAALAPAAAPGMKLIASPGGAPSVSGTTPSKSKLSSAEAAIAKTDRPGKWHLRYISYIHAYSVSRTRYPRVPHP
jgi:hypothetical protein